MLKHRYKIGFTCFAIKAKIILVHLYFSSIDVLSLSEYCLTISCIRHKWHGFSVVKTNTLAHPYCARFIPSFRLFSARPSRLCKFAMRISSPGKKIFFYSGMKAKSTGAFHSTNISGQKSNGTGNVPGKIFENLLIRFQSTLFMKFLQSCIEISLFPSRWMSDVMSRLSVSLKTWPLKQLGTGLESTRVVDQSVKGEYKREKIIINYYEKFEHVQSW